MTKSADTRFTRSQRLTLLACILGSSAVFLDGTIVNVALPAIRSSLHGGLGTQEWVVDAYLLTLGSLLLVGGSLGDLFGRREIFALGVAGFGITSLICAAAPNAGTLIGARAVQGIAGALLVPSTLALIIDTFDDHQRAAAIGAWTAWTGIATVAGPLLGGLLIAIGSWRWVFVINAPLVLATLALVLRIPGPARAGGRVDWFGGVLGAAGLAGPIDALIEQPSDGWSDPRVFATLAGGGLLLTVFVWWERRAEAPMLPFSMFATRNFTVGNLATICLYGALNVTTFFLVVFLQQVGGYTALAAGLSLLPLSIIVFLLARRFGALADRLGPRLFMGIGPLITAAGLLWLLRLGAHPHYLVDLLPSAVLFGLGLAVTVAPLTAAVLAAADSAHAGVAAGINNAAARVAGLLAIAVVGAVIAGEFGSHVHRALDVASSSPGYRAAVRHAAGSVLSTHAPSYFSGATREHVHRTLRSASVSAFHTSVLLAAILALVSGVLSLLGIDNPRGRVQPDKGNRVSAIFAAMSATATPDEIRQALLERSEIALLDLRPEAPFAAGHPLFAACLPIDRLELEAYTRIPRLGTPIVVYGADAQASEFGAARLRRLGYSNVRTLTGGLAGWREAGYEVFCDVNAPSKAFGELVAHELDTPFIEPQELLRQIDAADDVTVLDGRRFDEYQTMSVPTAASAPNATLVRHVASLPEGDDLVVVNCAGRTRSIIGAQTLVHTALRPRVAALRNGTIGWTLAGQALEHGRDRRAQGEVTERAIAAARGFADRAGVTRASSAELAALDPDARTVYRFDVRSPEAFLHSHLTGFVSAPGGQLIQETDYYAPVRGAKMVLADDDSTEANVTAAWLAQMGWDVTVLHGVRAADGPEHGSAPPSVPPLPEIPWLSAAELASARQPDAPVAVIDLGTHRAYTSGHIPGALWGSRADLLADSTIALPRAETYVLTAESAVLIAFAVADLAERLPGRVVGLSGGTRGWADAGLPLSSDGGITLSVPRDRYTRPYEGTEVSESAMRAYLEWEYGLVDQLERDGSHHFRPLRPA